MKRFEKLVIENFQSHEHTEVDFTEGLNVFVGPSDSGKSAVLRALRWVLYNQPKGTDYIRAGKSRCRVSLTLSDGTVITRIRSSSVNRYILRDKDGTEQVFEGFGSQVPLEVAKAHGMHALRLDTDWNLPAQFGTQLEGPFLLSETGSVKAKSIGRVSGAHLMDIALQGTIKDLKDLASDLKHQTLEAENLKKKLQPYNSLPRLLNRLERSEALHRTAEEMAERLENVRILQKRLDTVRQERKRAEERLRKLSGLEKVERNLMDLEKRSLLFRRMGKARSDWDRLARDRNHWEKVDHATRHLNRVESMIQKTDKYQEGYIRLRSLHRHLREVQRETDRFLRVKSASDGIEKIDPVLLEARGKRLKALQSLLPRKRRIQAEKQRVQKRLTATDRLPVDEVETLMQRAERLKVLKQTAEEQRELQRRLEKGRRYLSDRRKKIDEWTEKLVRLFRELGRCPTCGAEMDHGVLEHIMEEYRGGVTGAAAGREDQGN